MKHLPTLLLSILISLFTSNIASSQQLNWEKLNTPMGAEIYSVVEDSSGVVFISTETGIYKSADDCNSWQKVTFPFDTTKDDYSYPPELFVLGNGDLLAVLKGMKYSSDKGKTWQYLDTNQKDLIFDSFTNAPDGNLYGVKSYYLYKYSSKEKRIDDIHTFDGNEYYSSINIDKENNLYLTGTKGVSYSSDNGQSWTHIGLDTLYCRSLIVSGKGTIIVSGYYPGLYSSSDLGKSWKFYEITITDEYPNLILKSIHGKVYTIASNSLYCSSNDGSSWNKVQNGPDSLYHYSVFQTRKSGKLLISANSTLFIVDPDKQTWTEKNPRTDPVHNNIFLPIDDNIFLMKSAYQALYRSTDAGKNWQDIRSQVYQCGQYPGQLFETNKGLIVYSTGIKAMISPDKGESWKELPFNIPDTNFANAVQLFADSNGTFHAFRPYFPYTYDSKDYGKTWQKTVIPISDYIDEIEYGKNIIVARKYRDSIFVSTDNGKNWNFSLNPSGYSYYNTIDILIAPGDVIYCKCSGGASTPKLFRSKDKGKTWQDLALNLPLYIGPSIGGVKFSPKGEIYAFVCSGIGTGLYRNVNDSLFYRFFKNADNNNVPNFRDVCISEQFIYLSTYDNHLLKTSVPNDYPVINTFEVSPSDKQIVDWRDTLEYSIKVWDNKNQPVDNSMIIVGNELSNRIDTVFIPKNGTGGYSCVIPKGCPEKSYTLLFRIVNPDYVFNAQNYKRIIEVKHIKTQKLIISDTNFLNSSIPDTISIYYKDIKDLTFYTLVHDYEKQPVKDATVKVIDHLNDSTSSSHSHTDGIAEYFTSYKGNKSPGIYPINFVGSHKDWLDSDTLTKYVYLFDDTGAEDNYYSNNIKISPNPARDMCQLTVTLLDDMNINIELFNLLGNSEMSRTINARQGINVIIVDIASIPPGAYYIKVSGKGFQEIRQVVINR